MADEGETLGDGAADGLAVHLRWRDLSSTPIEFCDHLLITLRGDHFVLAIGQTELPQMIPGDDIALSELRSDPTVWIRPLGRFALPKSRLLEFLTNAEPVMKRARENDERGGL